MPHRDGGDESFPTLPSSSTAPLCESSGVRLCAGLAPGALATFRTRSVARTLPRRSEMMGRMSMISVEAAPTVADDVLEFLGTVGGSL